MCYHQSLSQIHLDAGLPTLFITRQIPPVPVRPPWQRASFNATKASRRYVSRAAAQMLMRVDNLRCGQAESAVIDALSYRVPCPRSSGARFSSSGILVQFGRNVTPDMPGLMSPVPESNSPKQAATRKRTTYADYLLHVREVGVKRAAFIE